MIIEFADPGYDWAFVFISLGIFLIGFFLFILPFWVTDDPNKVAMWPMVGLLIVMCGPALTLGLSAGDYNVRVTLEKAKAIKELGFEQGRLEGDRFTAATEDGQYFRGVLVDLEPESGYAYQVLELIGTEK